MTKQEALEAIIKEVDTTNFCGYCLEMKCNACEKESARESALQALQALQNSIEEQSALQDWLAKCRQIRAMREGEKPTRKRR